jgi:hypothetical protein
MSPIDIQKHTHFSNRHTQIYTCLQ